MRRLLRRGSGIVALVPLVLGCSSKVHSTADIQVPPGFRVTLYAQEVPNARSLALGTQGTLFVGTRSDGRVFALRDEDGDGRAERRWTLAQGLDMPNGVAFWKGALYLAEIDRILRYDAIESHLDAPPVPVTVAQLPPYTHHGWRYLGFGPDDRLYLAIGAPCNVCELEGELGTIISMRPDGSDRRIYARGVRNSVGFTWHPLTRELWFTDNGRDWLGDDVPPDELNRASRAGQDFGFPYCHGGDIVDPEFGDQRPCSAFTPPVQRLGPHVAALGVHFYTGSQFPAKYRNQIFIAEHGSWNRSSLIGYRISLVRLKGDQILGYETFAEGWRRGGVVYGRPVDLLVMPDGALLVSDDTGGKIYRISYKGK